jgi:prepilin-type N-terminal cleavage/methylation domain-containing protein
MSKSGFTLLELIVVVIIIGILASIAAPMMISMKGRAICAEAVAALGTIRTTLKLYYLQNGTYPPLIGFITQYSNELSQGGLQVDDLNGTFFSKECYWLAYPCAPDNGPPGNYIFAFVSPEDMGGSLNRAPRANETARIVDGNAGDWINGYLVMYGNDGSIEQGSLSCSGYPVARVKVSHRN